LVLACLALILVYALAAAWVFEIWAMLAAQAAIFALVLPTAFIWLCRGFRPTNTSIWLPLAAAVLWGVFQLRTGATVDRFVTGLLIVRTASIVYAVVLALYAFEDENNVSVFRSFLIVTGTAVAAGAIAQLFTADGKIFWMVRSPHTPLPMGPFLSRDSYAAFVELVLPVALWRAARAPRAWLFAACAAVMYASVIVSLSRAGSFLALLEVLGVPVAVLLVERRRARHQMIWRSIGATALAITVASLFGWQSLLHRFTTTDPWQMRREYTQSSIAMIRAHPFIGFGLGVWPIVYPRFAVLDMTAASPHAHNDWIEWASDGGIPYALLLLIPVLHASKRAFRRPWAMGIPAMSLHALVDFPYQVYSLLLLFFLLFAAVEAAEDGHRRARAR
jgi:O-antigen ligase